MTLEAELRSSSVQVDDYAWHDFLTERDFRPEDLWAFDCEARLAGTRGPHPDDPAPPSADPPYPDEEKPADGGPHGTAPLSQRVWESTGSVPDGVDGDDGAPAACDAVPVGDAPPADGAPPASDAHRGDHRSASVDPHRSEDAGLTGRVVLTELENLTLDDSSAVLRELAGLRSWVDAMETRIVSRLADLIREEVSPRFRKGNHRDDMARSVAASEVALICNIPERTATRLVEESMHLTEKHPAILEALESGSISRRHAVLIADESLGLPAAAVAEFESDLLDQATRLTVAKLARRARRLREAHHPETLPVRRARAVTERHVELRPDDDGMAWLHAYLPAEQACGIYRRLTATAQKLNTLKEPRTLTQLRADVFSDLLTGAPGPGEEPTLQGITAQVNITVPVLALLDVLTQSDGRDQGDAQAHGNNNAAHHLERMPDPRGLNQFAELEGYGPIDAETAARLAAHAPSFTRILTHPVTGSVLDVGRETYRPPKHLQDWVRARDRTCRHPGCNRVADGCEIDHTVPWARGGTTSHRNLACFCPKHHMYKSEGIFRYHQPTPGTIVARTRAGTVRTSTPDPPF